MNTEKRWINPQELCEEFGFGKNTQSTMRKEGKIPFSKVGGFVLYDRNLINKWLEAHCLNDMGLSHE